MKTNVKSTSLKTYGALSASGYLSEKEQQIMAAFQGGHTFTRQQLVHAAGMDINGVCGRVNALLARATSLRALSAEPSADDPSTLRLPASPAGSERRR